MTEQYLSTTVGNWMSCRKIAFTLPRLSITGTKKKSDSPCTALRGKGRLQIFPGILSPGHLELALAEENTLFRLTKTHNITHHDYHKDNKQKSAASISSAYKPSVGTRFECDCTNVGSAISFNLHANTRP